MYFWGSIYFMNANSPMMEQMIFFHDYMMLSMIQILIILLMLIFNIKKNNYLNLNLTKHETIEILWTIMPIFILFLMALPSLRILYMMEEIFTPNITVKIIGHQWYWSYEYSDFEVYFDSYIENIENKMAFRLLETDLPFLLPLNYSVRALITSADVIHSWTIQSLGVKSDALPGRLNQLNLNITRPGVYYGQCSEICGMNHSFMPICMKIMKTRTFFNIMKSLL